MSQYALSVIAGTLEGSIPNLGPLAAEALAENILSSLIEADAVEVFE